MTGAAQLLLPAEVADMFKVRARTVARWARTGRLTAVLSPTGHRRFNRSEVFELLGRVE